MPAYQYKRIFVREDRAEAALNDLGKLGWQLIRFELIYDRDPDEPLPEPMTADAIGKLMKSITYDMPQITSSSVHVVGPVHPGLPPPMMLSTYPRMFLGYLERVATP